MFELFDKAVDTLSRATDAFCAVLSDFDRFPAVLQQIHDFEQEGDAITHDILKELNRTFLTPIDRENIHALAARIDDVLDLIWACADRMNVYGIDRPTPEIRAMAGDVQMIVWILKKVVRELRSKGYEQIREYCIEINRIENRVDRSFRDALGKLLNGSSDALTVIKWKDIYQLLEDASDRCEDVADILDRIVLKHA